MAHRDLDTPIGTIGLHADAHGLVRIRLPGSNDPWPPQGDTEAGQDHIECAAQQITQYFAGERTAFTVPLAASGTPFQDAVWSALRTIPYGTTWSYAELASAAGRPGAFRAVGKANAANPLPIIVPCHRVVSSDGGLGGYMGGPAAPDGIKARLLGLEGAL